VLGEFTGTQIGTIGPETNPPSICRDCNHLSTVGAEFAPDHACSALRSGPEVSKLSVIEKLERSKPRSLDSRQVQRQIAPTFRPTKTLHWAFRLWVCRAISPSSRCYSARRRRHGDRKKSLCSSHWRAVHARSPHGR
jgi:hypothetical protein